MVALIGLIVVIAIAIWASFTHNPANIAPASVAGVLIFFFCVIVQGVLHSKNQKKCPYCTESTPKDATVCKHCGRDLPDEIEKHE